jgi:hypothetical protein
MAGGRDVPDEYIAELTPDGLAAMIAAGTLVDVTPPPASRSEQRRKAVQEPTG